MDKPVFSDPSKDITLYCGGNDGFWENSYHDTQEHWKSVNIHVSTGLVRCPPLTEMDGKLMTGVL